MGVELRPATEQDISAIVARGIRRVDQIEADAIGRGNDIEGALSESMEGAQCYVMADETGPFVIGGITRRPHEPNIGVPWFICTDDIVNHRFSFSRVVRDLIRLADKEYDTMEQWMWVENDKARGFAEAVGFEFDDDGLRNINGLDFVHFHRSRPGRA